MSSRHASFLFPEPPRDFPGRRFLKIGLRGAHVVCASLCFGAYAFDALERIPWLVATAFTGTLILVLDLHESAAFLLQVRGVVVLAKVLSLAFVGQGGAWLLGAIVLVSVVSSHAPSQVRYRVLLGCARGAQTRG